MTDCRYHSTDVVSFNAKKVILRTGGWMTKTTKDRMNQASAQFGLGFSVTQRKGVWYVGTNDYTNTPCERLFIDGMEMERNDRTGRVSTNGFK